MKVYFGTIFTALLLILQSCASVAILSNKQTDYNKRPKKIYIVLQYTNSESGFCTHLSEALQNKLMERGICSAVFLKGQLSLASSKDIEKKIAEYNPDAVLRIEETEETPVTRSIYELTLVDAASKKNVWKGDMNLTEGVFRRLPALGPTAGQAVINQLVADKVI